ncbi:coiled-coil domain-containing protein 66 isoform X2 [Thalassophryne amazonica]|uniref:coiled-coil domain-containing protein 66 isoform X2 n=1 Tax=Thalassophryne amazonica TaxID=390379 RepID=UPI0014710BD9|nr:coiled-coil domain-containing protein 66 isoform X2 [Thalassophryne amazonica]
MNLGDGLLFELENGKPRLFFLRHGVNKPSEKPPFRPRPATVLSIRQPSCTEEVQGEEQSVQDAAGRRKDARSKVRRGAAASIMMTSSKSQNHQMAAGEVKLDAHKHSARITSCGPSGNTGKLQHDSGNARLKYLLGHGNSGFKDGMVCLTNEQLRQILSSVKTATRDQRSPEDQRSSGLKIRHEDNPSAAEGSEEKQEEGGGATAATSDDTHDTNSRRDVGVLCSWFDERDADSRAAADAKKVWLRKELDQQVALKQKQRSAPGRVQVAEDLHGALSAQSAASCREQPAAMRSSLRLGVVTPMEETQSTERKEAQRRYWLEELDRQREEVTERRRREKLLQRQTEDDDRWARHFDSLQMRPPVPPASLSTLPPAPERGEWAPSSSLSLVWEVTSSCEAESVGGARVDTATGHQPSVPRVSYLRSMTALLDPAQIEEREKRRLKQLEQQRMIKEQIEEHRQQREREDMRKREEELDQERSLQRTYQLDSLKDTQKEQQNSETGPQRTNNQQPRVCSVGDSQCLDRDGDKCASRDTAVQTDATLVNVLTPEACAEYRPPPSGGNSRAARAGKENVCVPAGRGDPYEIFARTERSRKDKRRPAWNTHRPSCRFIPASERYPATLQRNRQESRQRRQVELLALQERTCQSKNPPSLQEPHASNPRQSRTSPSRTVGARPACALANTRVLSAESVTQKPSAADTNRGRTPTITHTGQSQQDPPTSMHPPGLEFIPDVWTDKVLNLDPLDPTTSPMPTNTEAPPHQEACLRLPNLLPKTHSHPQQEILRGLAHLRQGLLLKQQELESNLQHHQSRAPSATH